MYQMMFIARNNLSRKKSDATVLTVLVMIAALLLYISISVLRLTPQVIGAVYDEMNTADFFYCSACPETEKIREFLERKEGVEQLEYSQALNLYAKYHAEGAEEKESSFLIEPIELAREICKIPDIGEKKEYRTILLPYYMKTGEGIAEGDKFYLTLGDGEYEFTVGGFAEDPLFATPLNINVFRCYITQDCYDDLLQNEPKVQAGNVYLYKLKLGGEIRQRDFDADVSSGMPREIPELADYMSLSLNGDTMKVGTAFLSNIGMGILLIFSVVLICIALIIVWFSIKNFIDGNLKNLGILMASGYTKGQLMCATCTEMLLISLSGACMGLAAGGLLHTAVGGLIASLIGLRWNQSFDAAAAAMVFALVNMVVLGVTLPAGRIYGRIEILEALRGGIRTHNFRRNLPSLVTSRLPEPLALGVKSILGEKRKNAAITGIVVLLGFACCMGFALVQNFGVDDGKLLELMGVETGTATVSGEHMEEVGQELESWEEVRKVLYNDSRSVQLSAGEEKLTVTCDFWKDLAQKECTALIEGRLPAYDNEVCLTAPVAKQLGVGVGDIVYAEGDLEKKDYMVSGINQQMQELGFRASMTMEGAGRINGGTVTNMLYVFTREGCTYEQLEKKLTDRFTNLAVSDSQKYMETVLVSVKAAMLMICIVFVIITVVIVSLVIILLVRTKITREWKQYGIYKALGFTTGELILQIQMSSLPVFLAGALLGAVLSIYLLNPLVEVCLGMAGIVQSNLSIEARWLALSVAIIMAVASVVSFLCAWRVRGIEPVKMLTEE